MFAITFLSVSHMFFLSFYFSLEFSIGIRNYFNEFFNVPQTIRQARAESIIILVVCFVYFGLCFPYTPRHSTLHIGSRQTNLSLSSINFNTASGGADGGRRTRLIARLIERPIARQNRKEVGKFAIN